MNVQEINGQEFLHLVADPDKPWLHTNRLPVLIDFFAHWCGPCNALNPILEEAATMYADCIQIYKIDVDKETELTEHFNIRTIPTLLFSRPGIEEPVLMLGVMGKTELKGKIETLLLAPSTI